MGDIPISLKRGHHHFAMTLGPEMLERGWIGWYIYGWLGGVSRRSGRAGLGANVAQLAEQRIRNAQVIGSIPIVGSKILFFPG